MEEKIDMLLERLKEYQNFADSSTDDKAFMRGYSKGWKNAFDDAIFLVKLYLKKEGETDDWNIWRDGTNHRRIFWVSGRGVWRKWVNTDLI